MDDQPLLVTVTEAARRFGKSLRTIRRWMVEGRLVVVDTPVGKMVDLSGFAKPGEDVPPDATGTAKLPGATPAPELAALELQVTRLQGEVEKLNVLAQQLTGERDYLRQALAAAMGMQKMILAERSMAVQPLSRPWWQFWRRR
jgi:hypothetical protein